MRSLRARTYTTAFSGTVIAFVFALLCLVVKDFETWIPSWEAKPGKVTPVTVRLPAKYFRVTMLRSEFHYLSTTSSACPRIVPRGTRLKPGQECTGLVAAVESARRSPGPLKKFGGFVFYFSIAFLTSAFMRQHNKGRARLLRAQLTVFSLLAIFMAGSKALLLFTELPALVLPIVTIPLLAAYFFTRHTSFIIALVTALIGSSLLDYDIEHFFIFFASGMTVLVSRGIRHRAWIQLKWGALASWVALIFTVVTTLIFSGTLDIHDDLTEHLDPRYSLWISALVGGLASGILAWPLTPLVGHLVGEVSRSTLLDLQDLDQRLLVLLRERAPGTWEHARAMANLAEAAANAIGGNALLARIGAYYHDIGKSAGPEYFIENQAGGPNPHDELNPEESAARIFRHVSEGARILRAEGIPEDVVEFCYSHHGSGLLEYFWHKNMAEGNPEELSEKDFSYPGHKPSTRETGILMLVDAIEAAARTVDVPEKAKFQTLVQQIVFSKLFQGQLDETGLTIADLKVISNTIVDTLVNMYHARIKYPWQTTDTGSALKEDLVAGKEESRTDKTEDQTEPDKPEPAQASKS